MWLLAYLLGGVGLVLCEVYRTHTRPDVSDPADIVGVFAVVFAWPIFLLVAAWLALWDRRHLLRSR